MVVKAVGTAVGRICWRGESSREIISGNVAILISTEDKIMSKEKISYTGKSWPFRKAETLVVVFCSWETRGIEGGKKLFPPKRELHGTKQRERART